MSYINIIITACIVFPVLAFFITLPFVIYNYNKYGSVLFIRALLIYGFVLYLMSAYFLIIMPLPSISEVAKMTTKVQLVPFDVFSKIYHTVYFDYKDISTYVNIFKNAYVYQSIYNFLLTVPFGIFLRYYFRCNFKKTIFFTFLLSLFFELTQLTGLYFIYPNAYRLFDVDDLFINTLGGLFGYAITPLFTLLLPSAKELDIKSYKKGEMKMDIEQKLFSGVQQSFSADELNILADRFRALKEKAADGEAYRRRLETDINKYAAIALPELRHDTLDVITRKMSAVQLEELSNALAKRADGFAPPKLAARSNSDNKDYNAFRGI